MSGTDDSGGFLRRWSRLKRTGEVEAAPQSAPEPVAIDEAEEIAVPPPAETIPLEEIGQWLRKKLPAGWREVALRRVWSADTMIRDHIGLADYAWDFTATGDMPGAVPGWGPLTSADDLASLLRRAIGDEPPAPAVIATSDGDVAIQCDAEALDGLPRAARNDEAVASEMQEYQVVPATAVQTASLEGHRRRGGAATPIFLDEAAIESDNTPLQSLP